MEREGWPDWNLIWGKRLGQELAQLTEGGYSYDQFEGAAGGGGEFDELAARLYGAEHLPRILEAIEAESGRQPRLDDKGADEQAGRGGSEVLADYLLNDGTAVLCSLASGPEDPAATGRASRNSLQFQIPISRRQGGAVIYRDIKVYLDESSHRIGRVERGFSLDGEAYRPETDPRAPVGDLSVWLDILRYDDDGLSEREFILLCGILNNLDPDKHRLAFS